MAKLLEPTRRIVLPGDADFVVPGEPHFNIIKQLPPLPQRRQSLAELQRQHELRRFDSIIGPSQDLLDKLGVKPMQGGAQRPSYVVYNSAMATTAAPVSQPTGTAIRTMAQHKPATGFVATPIAWGISFDGSAAATPGKVELIETDVAATSLSTAYAAADYQLYGDPNADANTAGTSGIPFNLGTSAGGFATAAVTEGTITATRVADLQLIAPTNQYTVQFPLGREFAVKEQRFLRVRVTFGTTVNMIAWVLFEV